MQIGCDKSRSFVSAVREGKLELVRDLISSVGLSYSRYWSDGYVLLCEALRNKHTEVAKLLLANGSKVNNPYKSPSDTPLHFAVANGDTEIIEMLLDRGADIDTECEDGATPLHDAVRWKKMKVLKLFLSRGANANAEGKYGKTSLHTAAGAGYLQFAKQLLKHGARVNSVCTYVGKDCCTPLHVAVMNEHEKVVKLLLECGANVDAEDQDGNTILYFAVQVGHSLIVEHLLKHRPDVTNKSNRSTLNGAVHGEGEDYSKIVENLVGYGFNVDPVDANNCELLHAAVGKGYLTIVKELLNHGTDVNLSDNSSSANGCTPLHVASENKQEEVAKLLISCGADVNARDKTGETPIFYAVAKSCREMVELLLHHGADVNASDNYGRMALHFTALNEHVYDDPSNGDPDFNVKAEIAKLLLSRGANANARNINGRATLHAASAKGYAELVEALLEYNADVNCRDNSNRTPLHMASRKRNLGIVEILLKFGAGVDSEDDFGETPLRIACNKGHGEIAVALLEHGSDTTIMSSCYDEALHSYESDDNLGRGRGRGNSARDDIARILKRHIVKVKIAKLYARRDLPSISSDDETSIFRKECEEEVARMKSEKFGNANIAFYDILAKGISQLAIYAGNESIVRVLGSDDYKRKFPIYATMINRKFRKGERRKELMERGNKLFHFLFTDFLGIPHDCTEEIFNYLSDKDLTTVLDACKPISVSSPNSDINNVVIST